MAQKEMLGHDGECHTERDVRSCLSVVQKEMLGHD